MTTNCITKPETALAEAPASWNTRYITPEGFECQLTLRGETGQDVLERATGAIAFLLKSGCIPCTKTNNDHTSCELATNNLPQNSPMFETAPEQRHDQEPIVYEQPLNERMRAFMRLEFLWQQLSHHAGVPDAWSSRAAAACLLEMLAITARGDSRGDVLKELERQMSALRDFQNRPGVDGARLRAVLSALMRRREELNAAGANFMHKLRESEFLNAIKHRSAIPGGTCEFDLPDFYHWLSLDPDAREADPPARRSRWRPLIGWSVGSDPSEGPPPS